MHNSGFQLPQGEPPWARFADRAIQLQADRPIANTAEMVNQAVSQINNILKLASPEEKMKREMQREQFAAMRELYQDYRANPKRYQMTAHGPVLIDPYARMERIARINSSVARAKYLNRKTGSGSAPPFIANKVGIWKAAMQAKQNGAEIPKSTAEVTYEAANSQSTTPETYSEDVATRLALGEDEVTSFEDMPVPSFANPQ